jgi:hypothetical protein
MTDHDPGATHPQTFISEKPPFALPAALRAPHCRARAARHEVKLTCLRAQRTQSACRPKERLYGLKFRQPPVRINAVLYALTVDGLFTGRGLIRQPTFELVALEAAWNGGGEKHKAVLHAMYLRCKTLWDYYC